MASPTDSIIVENAMANAMPIVIKMVLPDLLFSVLNVFMNESIVNVW
jgi:hypothetical protein